jgi:general secretion pathway protein D
MIFQLAPPTKLSRQMWKMLTVMLMTPSFHLMQGADSEVVTIAEREIQRRMQELGTEMTKVELAEQLLRKNKASEAMAQYEEAYFAIPDLPLTRKHRSVALEGYLRAGLIRARELINAGSYDEATKILEKLDSPSVAKGDRGIRELKQIMADPDRFPPALTPQHIRNVNDVQRLLTHAASQFETGMYDRALETYEEVLRLDPTNSAARRGMERVENERARYFNTAKDHQRSRMLNRINELWENKPGLSADELKSLATNSTLAAGDSTAKTGRENLAAKLRDLKIQRIDFTSATLEEVIEYLRVRSRDVDPTHKGIDFVMSLPADVPKRSISLNLVDVPISEVLRYATEVAGVSYRVEEFAIRIVSLTDTNTTLISKSYRVPPDFIATAAVDPAASSAPTDPFAQPGAAAAGTGLIRRMGVKEFLGSRGVTFPEGSGASYNPVTNMLIVRNTVSNLEAVDSIVDQALSKAPRMAVIEVKIMEINQTKLDEMGFDWLLGGFGGKISTGGGTSGNQQTSTFANDEFPSFNALNNNQLGPVTAGLRSSPNLNTTLTIEDVLFGAVQNTSSRSPGIFSLAGVLTEPQFSVVWRGLDQKTGVDLLSKPSVVTKGGQKASIEIVREFIYPTEFDPPQIPTNVGSNTQVFIDGVLQPPPPLGPIPVTPTTPTAFETRRVGMILDVEPVISEDARSVDLTITPEFTEFIGFVNYGSPINSVTQSTNDDGSLAASAIALTPNTILQPIFSTKKINTAVKVYDGSTVVLGGLITDSSIMIDDKVPVIGSLPVVGKLFQSKVKQRRMKNMIMFVTVKVIDPAGNRVNRP